MLAFGTSDSFPSQAPVSAGETSRLGSTASCQGYGGLPPGWGRDPRAGMVRLRGGRVIIGSNDGYPEERPAQERSVGGFWIDRTEVTNRQFANFVNATGYVTEVERMGSAAVFRPPKAMDAQSVSYGSWWIEIRGADWRHPEGPGSTLQGRENQAVVQVSRADAQAYARWLGRRLPTEAEWEYAAKADGGSERIERGPRDANGRPAGNFWQGMFPYLDVGEDGFIGRAPVGCFTTNAFHLHDMIGNVWEWTSDPWTGRHQAHGTGAPVAWRNAEGRGASGTGLIKGGSFLCSTDFCVRYRAAARHPQDIDLGAVHVGFRTVADES
jgi:sulfatase modifying factor 1